MLIMFTYFQSQHQGLPLSCKEHTDILQEMFSDMIDCSIKKLLSCQHKTDYVQCSLKIIFNLFFSEGKMIYTLGVKFSWKNTNDMK